MSAPLAPATRSTSPALLAALLTAGLMLTTPVRAQSDYPNRPITILVPLAPGGVADTVIRPVAQRVSEQMGATIVIENRPGGGGNVASMAAKQAAPDGYTLLLANNGPFAVNPALLPDLKFDPVKDFQPITNIVTFPSVLAVPANSPAKTVKELVDLAKSRPAGLTYGSQGVGSGGHINAEMFRLAIGAPLTHIPYKGSGQAVGDLVAGRFDLIFAGYLSVAGQVDGGQARLLGVTSAKRLSVLPNIPTLTEAGIPGVEMDVWHGLVAPAGTPEPIVRKLNAAFVKAMESPDIIKLMTDRAAAPAPTTPDGFAKVIADDLEKLGKVVRDAGIKLK